VKILAGREASAMPTAFRRVVTLWQAQDLARRFLLASAAVFVIGMSIAGAWVANRIEDGVTHNTAVSTALYFESFVAPLVQELAQGERLSPPSQEALSGLIGRTSLGRRVTSFKIWRQGDIIAFASRPELIGKQFPSTPKLRRAWAGRIAAGLDDSVAEENEGERAAGKPLLEIYVPIRQDNSDRIIAVAEFYEDADQLKRDIINARIESWLVIGGIAAAAVAALFGIVYGASRTIEQQRGTLHERIVELAGLLQQNDELRQRVERASHRVAEISERYLRRLGAELHDGPAQLLGFALLRLDAIGMNATARNRSAADDGEVETIRGALTEALNDIRNISFGLSLPALERLSMADTLQAAARAHARRTNTTVDTQVADLQDCHNPSVKAAVFRFVQEALNNATRHAAAAGQTVRARQDGNHVVIEVSDRGPGFDPMEPTDDKHLGLVGMRERIDSLGGTFEIESEQGGGSCLRARVPIQVQEGRLNAG
jgi:signal transduction histidine kinase